MEEIMADLKADLEDKRRQLQELVNSRSGANCSSIHSSGTDVHREMQIEELEEEIERMQKQET